MRNKKVFESYNFMIVDDHHYISNILNSVLAQFGATNLVLAYTFEEAIDLLHKIMNNPTKVGVSNLDMILIDYRLTGSAQSGWELAKYIRSQRRSIYEFVRILGVTAFADSRILKEGRDSGINNILAKPFSLRSIYDKVLGTINDDREFAEYFDGSYFGPERFEVGVSLDRDSSGNPLSGVKFVSSKKISQKISPDISTEFLDKELEAQERELKEMEGEIESKAGNLVEQLLSECMKFKSESNLDDKTEILQKIGELADKVRDDVVIFNFPNSIVIASYLARLAMIEGICEYRHISKIVEGLVLLLRMMIEGNGMQDKQLLDQLLDELKVLMKKITDNISQEATEEMFMNVYQ